MRRRRVRQNHHFLIKGGLSYKKMIPKSYFKGLQELSISCLLFYRTAIIIYCNIQCILHIIFCGRAPSSFFQIKNTRFYDFIVFFARDCYARDCYFCCFFILSHVIFWHKYGLNGINIATKLSQCMLECKTYVVLSTCQISVNPICCSHLCTPKKINRLSLVIC